MQHDSRNLTIAVHHSSVVDITLIALGAAFGWFFALAYQNQRRGLPLAQESARTPSPRPISPLPQAETSTATVASLASGAVIKKWMNGVQWASPLNLVMEDVSADTVIGATLQDFRALQTQTQQAAQDAHAAAFVKFNQTQDIRYSKQADAIVDKDDKFNGDLQQKVTSLVGGDISQLKAKSAELKQVAVEIPNAGNAIGQIDSFLGVFDQLIGLL